MKNRIDKIMPYAFPVILATMVGFFYFVDPIVQYYPIQCIWRVLTGTQCPACGFQRAIHALIHGNFAEALSYNYFFVVSVPLAIAAILAEWYNYKHRFNCLRAFIHNKYTLKTYVVLYFGWWILRNILNI